MRICGLLPHKTGNINYTNETIKTMAKLSKKCQCILQNLQCKS